MLVLFKISYRFQAKILYNIAIVGKYEDVPEQFFKVIEKYEPCTNMFVLWSSAIVRTCCQHKRIISECIRVMKIAIDLESNINNKLELAYQTFLAGQYEEAIKLFTNLTNEEEPVPKALEGIVLCQIAMNDINIQVNIPRFIKKYLYGIMYNLFV